MEKIMIFFIKNIFIQKITKSLIILFIIMKMMMNFLYLAMNWIVIIKIILEIQIEELVRNIQMKKLLLI